MDKSTIEEALMQEKHEPEAYQRILTTDEDRVLCSLRWLIRNGMKEIPVFDDAGKKSTEDAIKWINNGNEAFSQSDNTYSFYAYTRAVACALPDSEELARAYANRSAATCETNMYGDSLKDIDRVLAIGYPDNLKAELYIRQVKCLWAVNEKMCPEIEASIETAEKWIEKSDECNRDKLRVALNDMKTEDFLKTLYVEFAVPTDGSSMPKPPTGNQKIFGASESIELKHSEEFGRHLVAAQDIIAGQILFVDKAFVSIPSFESSHKTFFYLCCSNCSKANYAGVPCLQCVNMSYCDEKCRDEDWNNYHQLDCPIINQLLLFPTNPEMYLALRMTIKAFKEAGSLQRLKDKISQIDAIADPIEKLLEGNVFDSSKYASVYSLMMTDAPNCPFKLAISAALILSLLGGLTKIFGNEIKTVQDIIDHKWTTFMSSLILKNLQIAHRFNYKQHFFQPGDNPIPVAYTIQPLIALCNHSCDANVCVQFHQNVFAVIALQKIRKGQQIFLSYRDIDFQKFSKKARRKLLQDEYGFWCTCTACSNNWKLSAKKSYKRLSLSEREVRALEFKILYFNFIQTLPGIVSPEEIELLKGILNFFDVSTQNSCAEFFRHKIALRDAYKILSV